MLVGLRLGGERWMKAVALILASAMLVLSAGCSDDSATGPSDNRPFPGMDRNYRSMSGDLLVDSPFSPTPDAYRSPSALAPPAAGPGDANNDLASLKRMLLMDRPLPVSALGSKSVALPTSGPTEVQPSGSTNVKPTPVTPPGRP
jgi:hypothetical protein